MKCKLFQNNLTKLQIKINMRKYKRGKYKSLNCPSVWLLNQDKG